jgi:hypothetical protein
MMKVFLTMGSVNQERGSERNRSLKIFLGHPPPAIVTAGNCVLLDGCYHAVPVSALVIISPALDSDQQITSPEAGEGKQCVI